MFSSLFRGFVVFYATVAFTVKASILQRGLLSYCLFFILKNKYLNKLRNITVFAHCLFRAPTRKVAALCVVLLFLMILLLLLKVVKHLEQLPRWLIN